MTAAPALLLAAPVAAAVNLFTLIQFWRDKRRARLGGRRIPEFDLLFLAAIGGSAGALIGRSLFRHKTRKQPFSTRLWLIVALQGGALLGLLLF